MARSIQDDARGIVNPAELARTVEFTRHDPSGAASRFVSWYWRIRWDLGAGSHRQEVLTHPVVNVVFSPDGAVVSGVHRGRDARVLSGSSWVLGVMFRPGAFRPFLDRPMHRITGTVRPLLEIRPDGAGIEDEVAAGGPTPDSVASVNAWLSRLAPDGRTTSEDVADLVELVAADREILRVRQLADVASMPERSLQRLFAEHVGVSPKWVIRRYRLYEVAERAAQDGLVDLAGLAAELGYSDQSHLTRDFTSAYGLPPQRYVELCRSDPAASARHALPSLSR